MKTIKNIIFDLGGVILNINYKLSSLEFEKIGLNNFDNIYSKQQQQNIFNSFEKGEITSKEFIEYIKKQANVLITDKQIINSWNAMLLELPKYRFDFINKINKKYNIYLLSNTNSIHIAGFKKIIDKNIGYNNFVNSFKKIYLSSEIGIRKPDEECFKFVLNENKLLANETLFIDDSIQHINGANQVGLITHHLLNGEDITTVINNIDKL